MSNTILWSARWSTAKGYFWQHERECEQENTLAWMKVYQKDEPEIHFVICDKKPSLKELYKVTGWNPIK